MASAGRWSLLKRMGQAFPVSSFNDPEAAEEVARILLKRYGVVFKRLLEREGIALPWRVLLRTYHRLEARGEIRGGRFVAGISGEQFALPEAVAMLRAIRRARTGSMDFGFRSPVVIESAPGSLAVGAPGTPPSSAEDMI